MRKRSLRRRLVYASTLAGFLFAGLEVILRLLVPLSTLVVGDESFKACYLESVDSLRVRGRSEIIISDPELGWRIRPKLRLPDETSNSDGFRGTPELSVERTPGVRRCAFIGDSFTYGAFVGDREVYPSRIGQLLGNVEVLNLGVSGYGTDQILLHWLRDGEKYQPDFVVLGYLIADFHRNTTSWRGEAPKPRFRVLDGRLELVERELPSIENLDANEQLIRDDLAGLLWTPRVWVAGRFAWRRVRDKLRGHREFDETFDEKAAITRAILRRLKSSCDGIGAKFAVVVIPMQYPDYPDQSRIRDVLASSCSELNVPLLCLARDLDLDGSQLGSNQVFFDENAHWTPFGHRIASAQILEFLRSAGFVK